MTPIERLQTALNGLGLKAVEARLESLLEQASKKEPSYADFLDELLSCEVEARRSRYLRARLQLAHLPSLKNFDQFDFGFQPSIDERQIQELRHCGSFTKPATWFFLDHRVLEKPISAWPSPKLRFNPASEPTS